MRAARADVLVGQPESQRLDAKGQDYWLEDDAGKISLAQDVARFANGEDGGAIVIGLRTRKLADGEVVSSISPVPIPNNGVRRHRQAIATRVFPPPDGLSVEQVSVPGGAVIPGLRSTTTGRAQALHCSWGPLSTEGPRCVHKHPSASRRGIHSHYGRRHPCQPRCGPCSFTSGSASVRIGTPAGGRGISVSLYRRRLRGVLLSGWSRARGALTPFHGSCHVPWKGARL